MDVGKSGGGRRDFIQEGGEREGGEVELPCCPRRQRVGHMWKVVSIRVQVILVVESFQAVGTGQGR